MDKNRPYSFVGEDEHTFRIKHPDGSEFTIAKQAVGDQVHRRIKELEPVKMADGALIEKPQDNVPIDLNPTLPMDLVDQSKIVQQHLDNQAASLPETPPEMSTGNPLFGRAMGTDQLKQIALDKIQKEQAAAAPTSDAIAGQQDTSREPATAPQTTATATGSGLPSAIDPNSFTAKQVAALDKQQAVSNAASQRIQNEYQQQALNQQKLATDIAEVEKTSNQVTAPWKQDNDQLFAAIKDQKIDPQRLYTNMSIGDKIGAAISVALSGIGSGLTGQKNMAMEVIDKSIDRDIDAQKAELGKKQTLFSENLRRIGDERAAAAVTKSQLLTAAQANISSSAARINSSESMQRNQLLQSELELKKADLHRQGAMFTMMNQQQSGQGGNPEALISYLRMYAPEKAKEMEARYVPGVGMAQIPIPTETRNTLIAKQTLGTMAKDFYKWTENHSGSLSPSDIAEGRTKAAELQSLYRNSINGGVFKKGEQEFIDQIVDSDPTKFFNEIRVLPKLKEIINSNDAQSNILKKGYGLPQKSAVDELSGQEKGYLQWAKQNPNDPRSAIVLKKLGMR